MQSQEAEELKKLIKLRVMDKDDIGFLYNSYLKSQRCVGSNSHISNSNYYKIYADKFKKILENSAVDILCNTDDVNQIYGYIIYDSDYLHYLYIKRPYRQFGLAKLLVEQAGNQKLISHIPAHYKDIPGFVFLPFI